MNKMCKINELHHNASDTVKDKAFSLALEEVFQEWKNSEYGSDVDDYLELLDDKDLKTLRDHSFHNPKNSALLYHYLKDLYHEDDEGSTLISAKELLETFKTITDEHGKPVYAFWKQRLFEMFCGIHHNN